MGNAHKLISSQPRYDRFDTAPDDSAIIAGRHGKSKGEFLQFSIQLFLQGSILFDLQGSILFDLQGSILFVYRPTFYIIGAMPCSFGATLCFYGPKFYFGGGTLFIRCNVLY